MSNDPDACLPGPLKDFVFDLHDSARRSMMPAEQVALYTGTFRELSSKYFATGPWPSPQSISDECGGDPLFLALYRELTHRHLHSVTRPQVHDRIDGWHVYRNLFDLILAEANGEGDKRHGDGLFILPEWAFDILHEFVYQFQGFCQFRTATYANVAKSADGGKQPPSHVTESLEALSQNRDAWAVETVLFYLHRLVAVGTQTNESKKVSVAFRYLGLFASVSLSRLECLLGDYCASLAALSPVFATGPGTSIEVGDETKSPEEAVTGVFQARLSLAYHCGVSYLMLRRYKDAAKVLGKICSFMQRGFKTGQLRKLAGSDQFSKLYDRMTALLAIITHVCPTEGLIDDGVARAVRDKHGHQLSKIEAGEEGYEDLFIFACPKFVSPAVPDYGQASSPGSSASGSSGQDAYKLQVKQFMNEMSVQQTLRKLRSYMKLYTSIGVGKLAAFNDMGEDEFLPLLLCYKHKMRQLEQSGEASAGPLDGKLGTALDIHYYISDDMVHVDEAEKQRRFENYFMAQIAQNDEILKDVEAILTDV